MNAEKGIIMKKVITIISITAVAIAIAVGALLSTSVINSKADDEITTVQSIELKIGKYHKVNGNENEYIEVFSDGTIQMFGFDYMVAMKELCGEEIVNNWSEETYKSQDDFGKYIVSRHTYIVNDEVRFIEFADDYFNPDSIGSGLGFVYEDENTLTYDKNLGYVYVYSDIN